MENQMCKTTPCCSLGNDFKKICNDFGVFTTTFQAGDSGDILRSQVNTQTTEKWRERETTLTHCCSHVVSKILHKLELCAYQKKNLFKNLYPHLRTFTSWIQVFWCFSLKTLSQVHKRESKRDREREKPLLHVAAHTITPQCVLK